MTETAERSYEAAPQEAIEPSYFPITKTATYGFLSAIPLILLYEVLIISANEGRIGQIRVSSEIWLKQWFQYIDGPTSVIMGVVLLVIGLGIMLYERKKQIPIKAGYFLGIVVESGFYAIIVALLVSQLVWSLFAMAPTLVPAIAASQLEHRGLGTLFHPA